MYKLFYISITIFMLGCASTSELEILAKYNAESIKAQSAQQDLPTLTVKCDKGNCDGLNLTFIHPSDRKRIVSQQIKGTNDVIIETLPSIMNMATWAIGIIGVTKIVDDIATNAGNNNTSINQTTLEGNNALDIKESQARDTFTSTTSSVVDRHDTVDSHNVISSHNATATPTVVTQPSPVLVQPSYPPVVSP